MCNWLQRFAIAGLLLFSASSLGAQGAPEASGHWEGSIQAPERPVPVAIDLVKSNTGEFAATFTGGDVKGFPLSNVSVKRSAVSFELIVNEGGTFAGTLSADGRSLSGDFTIRQGGFSVPFSLARTGEAHAIVPAKSAAITKELEGAWNGSLVADGRPMRVTMMFLSHPDGTSTGFIANLDQGAVEIPVTTITQKASQITLDVSVVGGVYTGALSADGSGLSGTWTQGSFSTPLNLKRASAK